MRRISVYHNHIATAIEGNMQAVSNRWRPIVAPLVTRPETRTLEFIKSRVAEQQPEVSRAVTPNVAV